MNYGLWSLDTHLWSLISDLSHRDLLIGTYRDLSGLIGTTCNFTLILIMNIPFSAWKHAHSKAIFKFVGTFFSSKNSKAPFTLILRNLASKYIHFIIFRPQLSEEAGWGGGEKTPSTERCLGGSSLSPPFVTTTTPPPPLNPPMPPSASLPSQGAALLARPSQWVVRSLLINKADRCCNSLSYYT